MENDQFQLFDMQRKTLSTEQIDHYERMCMLLHATAKQRKTEQWEDISKNMRLLIQLCRQDSQQWNSVVLNAIDSASSSKRRCASHLLYITSKSTR